MANKKDTEEESEVEGITFRCRVCEEIKPLDEMVVVTRFFPPVIACRNCEKKMR